MGTEDRFMNCCHKDTYELPELWPTGESIEACNCCGKSRAHWEQGESDWYSVDLVEGREIDSNFIVHIAEVSL